MGFCLHARTGAGILPTICPLSAGSNSRGFTNSLSLQYGASSRDLLEEKLASLLHVFPVGGGGCGYN